MAAPLNDRIAAALGKPDIIPAADVALLRDETRESLAEARANEAAAESNALDPTLPEDEANARREEAIRLGFLTRRMAAALSRLDELESACLLRDAEAARLAAYAEAIKARDSAATSICTKYPDVQNTLMSLLAEIAKANDAVARANADLPQGAAYLDSAEGVAFGYPDSPAGRVVGFAPASLAEMQIPDIKNWAGPAWPPGWHGGIAGRHHRQQTETWLRDLVKPKGRK